MPIYILLYDIFIRLYLLGIRIASPFSTKAKKWREGRDKLFSRINKNISSIHGDKIWVHCASLGEFEQARPLMEKLRKMHPEHKIILTFFSPSGYDVRRYYEGVDYVAYLPIDTAENAQKFIRLVKPNLVIWVKYEYWYHYLSQLHEKNIPVVLISAVFRQDHLFFKWYGKLHRKMLGFFTHIFVQNEESKLLLHNIGIDAEVCADTRFDRVANIAGQRKEFENVALFKDNKKVLIAGSTWTKDAYLMIRLINSGIFSDKLKYIIAPHDPTKANISYLTGNLKKKTRLLSRVIAQAKNDQEVLIVDTIGALSSLYYYGDIAYIGGGFNASIHNILEPAVYGMPVIFGPNHHKSLEAQDLLSHRDWHAAFSIGDYDQLVAAISSLLDHDEEKLNIGKEKSREYVLAHTGGTDMIYDYLISHKLI